MKDLKEISTRLKIAKNKLNFSKENESGSGLGLAIAKQGIELNKGTIQAITSKDNFEIKIKLPIKIKSNS